MDMKQNLLRTMVAMLTAVATCALSSAQLTKNVNPLIGTGRIEGALRGCNYPGATVEVAGSTSSPSLFLSSAFSFSNSLMRSSIRVRSAMNS